MFLILFACLALTSVSYAEKPPGERIVWDHFQDGFTVAPFPGAADGKWFYFDPGLQDPTVTIKAEPLSGLLLNQTTSSTINNNPEPFERASELGLFGGLNHVKWLAYMNNISSAGFPGHDAKPGHILSCESWIGGRSYVPAKKVKDLFGGQVADSEDDLRLAAPAMNTIDFQSLMVFDFFLTNKQIYAFYERLPFGRDPLNDPEGYAAFSNMIPVGERGPNGQHHLKISYNKDAGTVSWIIGGKEVFKVGMTDNSGVGNVPIGHPLATRDFLTIDHGGVEPEGGVVMNQLSCGMGLFTLLDGELPIALRPKGPKVTYKGLVRLSNAKDFYFDIDLNEEDEVIPQVFVDDGTSFPGKRLFDQTASMSLLKYVVESQPIK